MKLKRMSTRRCALTLAATAALIAILVGYTAQAHATAPGKNGRLVFRRYLNADRTHGAIFTVNPSGTSVTQVTHPRARVTDTEPDWSPNGARIAFERQVPCRAGGSRDGLNNTCDLIYSITRDGKGLKSLVPCRFKVGPAAGSPGNDCVGVDQPSWSPDGSKLAFQYNLVHSGYTGSYNLMAGIWIVDADGTGLHQVTQRTPATSWDYGPQWSPDGAKLVFYRSDLKLRADAVFTVNVDGSNEVQLTPWELNGGNSPDWSPDGQWILFTGAPRNEFANVYKIHPDGTGLTNLTKALPGGHQYLSSSFSPDGRMITTARTPGTGPNLAADVLIMNADGSNIRRVTKSPLWESGVDWGTAPLR
jgi:Tol biopolymer transport system component